MNSKRSLIFLLCLCFAQALPGAPEITEDSATGLTRYPNCEYIESDWNDGDSFSVRLTNGTEITARLYEADAVETHINNTTDARRLRAQRRYFGISDFGGSSDTSISKAIELGEQATTFTQAALLNKPFTIYTSHADARGGVNNKRIYTFIITDEGKSLAAELVRHGLARAYGVYRQTPERLHQDEARERFKDLEFYAAGSRKGIWAFTDWDALPNERLIERLEEIELSKAVLQSKGMDPGGTLNPNTATAEQLQLLPGIGPSTAEKIMAAREEQPFMEPQDLLRVSGIGPGTLSKLEPYLSFE